MPRKPPRPAQPVIDPRQVDVTTEYDVFKRLAGNRAVSETHVKNLMAAMQEEDLFTPILVNQDFEVIDGQHRLEARRRLGLPVPYYWEDGLGLRQVQNINSKQKGWTNADYANSYIELGNQNYITYKWFLDKFCLPHVPTLWLLSGGDFRHTRAIFQNGEFKVRDLEGAKYKAGLLTQLAPHFSHWKDAAFVKAFLICIQRAGFEFKTFLHRVKQNPTMLKPCPTIDGYLLLIEEVYNYRSPNKIPLRYGENATNRTTVNV